MRVRRRRSRICLPHARHMHVERMARHDPGSGSLPAAAQRRRVSVRFGRVRSGQHVHHERSAGLSLHELRPDSTRLRPRPPLVLPLAAAWRAVLPSGAPEPRPALQPRGRRVRVHPGVRLAHESVLQRHLDPGADSGLSLLEGPLLRRSAVGIRLDDGLALARAVHAAGETIAGQHGRLGRRSRRGRRRRARAAAEQRRRVGNPRGSRRTRARS